MPSRAGPRGRKYEAGNDEVNLLCNENTNKTLSSVNSKLSIYSVIHAVMITGLKVHLTTSNSKSCKTMACA